MTRLALRNPVSVLMLSVVVLVMSAAAIVRIPIDTLPKITIPALQVITSFTGADPLTVEQSVTYPLEKGISSVNGISYIQSVSKEGISVVKAMFDWGVNLDSAEVEIIQRANSVVATLPPGAGSPFVLKLDVSNFPVCAVALQSKSLDERQLYDVAYNLVEPALEHLDGVSTASVNGGKLRQINVLLDPDRLAAYGLSMQDVFGAVNNANFLFPSGDVKVADKDLRVYTRTQFQTIPPMNDIVVATPQGVPVHIKDLGRVEDGAAIQMQVVRINGNHGIMMFVTKQPGQNTVQVVDCIKAGLKEIRHSLHASYPDLEFNIFFDNSIAIKDSISDMVKEALLGGCLAGLVILLFLRSIRSTIFVSIAMPLSVAFCVLLMYATGQTFNTFTLGGLTLAMGRLVDDAIVVLENIYRHVNEGKDRLESALLGTYEVAMPVLASTIATVVVFLPIAFIQGFPKFLFGPLALSVTFALFASYLVSMTIVPVLCRYFLRPESTDLEHPTFGGRLSAQIHHFYDGVAHLYARFLDRVLDHSWLVTLVMVVVMGFGFSLVKHIGKELMPTPDENLMLLIGRGPIGMRVEETEKIAKQCEDMIRQELGDDCTVLASDCGTPGAQRGTNAAAAAFSRNGGPHGFTTRISLKPAGERSVGVMEYADRLRKKLYGRFPGVTLSLNPGGITSFLLNTGAQGAIDIQIYGFDLDKAYALARQVVDIIRNTPGGADPNITLENDYPELHIEVDREKAATLGLSQRRVAETILTALNGNTSSNTVWTDPDTGRQYSLITQYPPNYQRTISNLREIGMIATNKNGLKLQDFAKIRFGTGPVEIDRQNQMRVLDVTANAAGRPLGDVAQDIIDQINNLPMPEGFSVKVIGQFAQQQQSFGQMPMALLLAVLLVYAVMAAQFRSLMDPFIIIFTVPLGLVGVFFMLYYSHTSLSVESFMGIITMIGIVVSNGILLVDFANHLRRQGYDARRAVVEASRVRLRPILMTAIATVTGLIPMAWFAGPGGEVNAPLARTVIGGLSVSTFLTLFFIPILYCWLEKRETQIGDDDLDFDDTKEAS